MNEEIKSFVDQNKKLMKEVLNLCDHPISNKNPGIKNHLEDTYYCLIMVQNSLWNQYFNYGRMKREREEKENSKHNEMFTNIKKMFGF